MQELSRDMEIKWRTAQGTRKKNLSYKTGKYKLIDFWNVFFLINTITLHFHNFLPKVQLVLTAWQEFHISVIWSESYLLKKIVCLFSELWWALALDETFHLFRLQSVKTHSFPGKYPSRNSLHIAVELHHSWDSLGRDTSPARHSSLGKTQSSCHQCHLKVPSAIRNIFSTLPCRELCFKHTPDYC